LKAREGKSSSPGSAPGFYPLKGVADFAPSAPHLASRTLIR